MSEQDTEITISAFTTFSTCPFWSPGTASAAHESVGRSPRDPPPPITIISHIIHWNLSGSTDHCKQTGNWNAMNSQHC
jgi:hypothetical protein